MAFSSTHNRNPLGRNQHGYVLKATDPVLQEALYEYHRQLITNDKLISELLMADHNINMKPRTVQKRRMELGLQSSRKTLKLIDSNEAEQLVIDQMDLDPAKNMGPRKIRHKISMKTGIHLPRDYVADTMRIHDSKGFEKRHPKAKLIHRATKVNIGNDIFDNPGLPASSASQSSTNYHNSTPLPTSESVRSSAPRQLRSMAFRTHPWSRNDVKMDNYKFTRFNAVYQADGNVTIDAGFTANLDTIEITNDWGRGQTLWKKSDPQHFKCGFLGCGSTKHAIYARYQGKEYALVQPYDNQMEPSEARRILKAELQLLAQCDGIKKVFDQYVEESENVCRRFRASIGSFYFNFEGSFYGELEPLSASGKKSLPHIAFLATPMLPSGRYDEPIKKFTGSDKIGPAYDMMTKTIHAYVHFAFIYTRGSILFCNMQGTKDRNGRMCLINPHAHTYV
ncbi:hypothetical protein JR316_0007886 [Psilocybe cubensis]|uniref:Uncharacterized protein n=2 Tax=Psilocybe cubensis TaxID=181762 RepID=A0ACB8GV27_PSICU|nr:hypothetical protein JR316_0007886 [Psilocybe cubensis]KAH9479297.1 hypothetical protein JR316_0007886 [Psilocybe cubensis]